MGCEKWGNATICRGPATRREELRSYGERWCFSCRGRHEFRLFVDVPVEPSYYGPNPSVRCMNCNTNDGDCFPGTSREWE